jgi:hypothetical protein
MGPLTLQSPLNDSRDNNNTNIATCSNLQVLHLPSLAAHSSGVFDKQTPMRLFWGFVSGSNRHFTPLSCDVVPSGAFRRFERAYFFHSQSPSFFVHFTIANSCKTFVRNVSKSRIAEDGIGYILRSFVKSWTIQGFWNATSSPWTRQVPIFSGSNNPTR